LPLGLLKIIITGLSPQTANTKQELFHTPSKPEDVFWCLMIVDVCITCLPMIKIKDYLRMKRMFPPNPNIFILFWNAMPTPFCMKAVQSTTLFPIILSIVWHWQNMLTYELVYCFENLV